MNDRPNGNMSAAELTALHANPDRHPNALRYELTRCKLDVLVTLSQPLVRALAAGDTLPADALASLAFAEVERRRLAVTRLLNENPTLRKALTS